MTAPMTAEAALERVLADLCAAADATVANKRGAMLMAADPARRLKMEDAHRTFAKWVPELRVAYRKLEAADALLSKTLRTVKPGVRA